MFQQLLPKELQAKSELELNEVPKRLQSDLEHISEWLRQQPYLTARTDHQWLLTFLRGCKFSLEKTKEKIVMYYTMRTISPYYFTDRNPFSKEIQKFWELNAFVMLPQDSNPLAPRRFAFIGRYSDPDTAPVKLWVKTIIMLAEILMFEGDPSVINGQEAIFDGKYMPYGYVEQFTPSVLKTIAVLLQRAYPARVKGIYFINIPTVVEFAISTFRKFLPEKFQNRVRIYSEDDYDGLFKTIPRDIYPNELGGTGEAIIKLVEQTRLKVESYKSWFEDDTKYGIDESKRPQMPNNYDELLNIEGSFRKLDID